MERQEQGAQAAAAPSRVSCQRPLTLFPAPPSPSRPPLPAFFLLPLAFPPSHTEETKKALSAEYIADQKAVDAALLKALTPELKGYLGTRFTLRDGDRPHLMKF